MRVLVETDVILDVLQKREPFFTDSYRLCAGLLKMTPSV